MQGYAHYGAKDKNQNHSTVDLLSILEHPHLASAIRIYTPVDCSLKGLAIEMPLGTMTLDKLHDPKPKEWDDHYDEVK